MKKIAILFVFAFAAISCNATNKQREPLYIEPEHDDRDLRLDKFSHPPDWHEADDDD